MRHLFACSSLLILAACGGAGPQSVGSSAAPVAPVGSTPTPTPASNHSFVSPTLQKNYPAIGGVHSYEYETNDRNVGTGRPSSQTSQLYAGDASTARNSGITIDYNPRDGIFEVKIEAPLAIVSQTLRFQDPVHRTDFGGDRAPQTGTPNLRAEGVQYLQLGSAKKIEFDPAVSTMVPVGTKEGETDSASFFYQRPGTETKYVTFAGFVRNATTLSEQAEDQGDSETRFLVQAVKLERAAFVFGERTENGAVPRTGTATFNGPMVATMVYNPRLDDDRTTPTYFQWLEGRSKTTVDFGAGSFTLDLTGTVFAPQFDAYTSREFTFGAGATFAAAGKGRVDLVGAGGFLGQFESASFTQGGVTSALTIAGSSIDGAFFGPTANEVGGGFRIVGGKPDERIDILGAFTGKQ